MRKAIIFCTVVLLSVVVFWQVNDRDISERPMSIELGKRANYKTFKDLRKSELDAKIKRKANGIAKKNGPDEFLKYHNLIRVKPGANALQYPTNYRLDELEKAKSNVALRSTAIPLDWKERGPGNVSGRTRALIIDPDDETCNTWFAGSVTGGVWKTIDAGESWTNLTTDLPNLSAASLSMAASNTQVVYIGAGEGFIFNSVDAVHGDGIFKSIDKGENWQQLESTISNDDFDAVNRMVVDPYDENTVIAVTNTSVQKTTDGGSTWRNIFSDDGAKVQQIITAINSLDTLYATVNNKGIIKSTDRGETWGYCLEMHEGRIEMAISPTNPSMLYALNQHDGLYMSEDYGHSWNVAIKTFGYTGLFLGTQGWYDNTLAVLPSDPYKLLIGGLDLYGVEVVGDSMLSFFKVDTVGTSSFMTFRNHNNKHFGGAALVNSEYYDSARIEIQFGTGKSQLAHRFTVPEGATSGVPATDYVYQDYVEVPFEVWDVDNNEQLMVSFRDQERDGVFDLEPFDDALKLGREYIWVNDVPYATIPNVDIALSGGQEYRHVFYTWPSLAEGGTWDPQNLPESKVEISTQYLGAKKIASLKMTDWSTYMERYLYSLDIDEPYVHADKHSIQFCQTDDEVIRIIVTHDGGVDYSDDMGQTWTNPTNGYNSTQFYGVDKKAGEDRYVGGTQDNGTWISLSDPGVLSQWKEATGGDGFDAVWHPYSGEIMTTIYNNQLVKVHADEQSWTVIEGIPDVDNDAPFITQIGYTPSAPNNLYLVGASGVSYSKDFGESWLVSSMSDSLWRWSSHGYVEPSLCSPDIIWASSRMDHWGHMMLSKDGGQNFGSAGNIDSTFNRVSGLATHPSNEKSAFVLFSYPEQAKILRTTNFGETWEDISGFENGESTNGFPDVAVYSLLVMPQDTSIIWVGTEIGLFISEDNGEHWAYSDNGLPAVSIWEIKIRDQQVVLATHGRGVWSLDMPEIPVKTALPFFMDVDVSISNQLLIDYVQASEFDSLFLVVDSTLEYKLSIASMVSELQSVSVDVALDSGLRVLQLVGYKDQEVAKSAIWPYDYDPLNMAQTSYSNSFDEVDNDFALEGMSVDDLGGLETTMALHSQHPYAVSSESYAVLKTPIILQSDGQGHSTKLRYSDIPMVQEGEDGSQFGASDFYDFVLVMGSQNGVDWIPLSSGYDYNSIKTKASGLGLTVDSVPASSLFEDREIDLLTFYEDGDTILICFYMYSDANTTGWGWVIDDIDIGMDISTSIEKQVTNGFEMYPIPCSEQLNVSLGESAVLPKEVLIYDMNGRVVKREIITNEQLFSIDVMGLDAASYILEVKMGNNESFRRQFMVVR